MQLAFTAGVLTDNGVPKPRLLRTAWALVAKSAANRNTFLDDCIDKNYTGIEFGAIWRDERTTGVPFANAGALLPFDNTLGGAAYAGVLTYSNINTQAPDFTTPNTSYWNFVKAIVDNCESRGLMVLLFPCYVGFPGTGQGWGPELVANGATKIETYGAFVGDLFADNGNIIWMFAGDQGTGSEPFDSTELAIQEAMYDGVTSASGLSTLWSAEFRRNSTTHDVAALAPFINCNMSYANADNIAVYTRQAYSEVSYQVNLQEGPFDQEGPPPDGNNVNPDATQPCRRFDYWSWLSGIGGYNMGNGYVWPFNEPGNDDDWQLHLSTQTAMDESRLNVLIKSIEWWRLIPSELNGMRDLVVAGGGTLGLQDYVAAACADDGSIMFAYVPPDHTGNFSLDFRSMRGPSRARWWDPTSAQYTDITAGYTIANTTASQSFTPPGPNDEGTYTDWLLVIDTQGDGMATTWKRLAGPALLTGSAATVYTCPAATRAKIQNIHVQCPAGQAATPFTISIGTDAAGTRIFSGVSVGPGQVYDSFAPFYLEAGEILQAFAGTTNILTLTVDGLEQTT